MINTKNTLKEYHYKLERNDNYYLKISSRYFIISEQIYRILHAAQDAPDLNTLYDWLEPKGDQFEEFKGYIDNKLVPFMEGCLSGNNQPRKNEFSFAHILIQADSIKQLTRILAPLYGKGFFVFLLIFSLFNLVYLVQNSNIARINGQESNTAYLIIATIAILVFHEIGHVAASVKYDRKPRGIGVGIYTVFPVLFSDITSIWTLNKREKTIVNLAGIFNQLLITSIFISITLLNGSIIFQRFVYELVLSSSLIIVLNLIPIIKLDGYWILSDLINVPNLLEKSNLWIRQFFNIRKPLHTIWKKKYLALYSMSRVFFFLVFFAFLSIVFLGHVLGMVNLLYSLDHAYWSIIPEIIFELFWICLILMGLTGHYRYIRNVTTSSKSYF